MPDKHQDLMKNAPLIKVDSGTGFTMKTLSEENLNEITSFYAKSHYKYHIIFAISILSSNLY